MNIFTIITNDQKDPGSVVSNEIKTYLETRGGSCTILNNSRRLTNSTFHYTDPGRIPEDTQCIIVLGGDGTLLQAARDTVERRIPLLGINLGTLGFLAEIDKSGIEPALDKLLRDECSVERRMMLTGTVYHKGKAIASDIALNDISFGYDGQLHVVQYRCSVNGEYLTTYKADGVIISTPTGSTGYNLSAGGPIMSPAASMILVTPLAPHTLNNRSIVFSPEDVITVQIGAGRDGQEEKAMVLFDGDTSIHLTDGDAIEIARAREYTQLIKLSAGSFLSTLGRKMNAD